MKLPGLKYWLVSVACLTGFPFVFTKNITIAATTPLSLQAAVLSTEPSIDPTYTPTITPRATISKPSSNPTIIPRTSRSKLAVEPLPVPSTTPLNKSSAESSDLSSNTPTPVITKKPNILIILADDVGTGDIPLYWNTGLVDMPNIQKLANMGVTFKDAHSTPLCSPSRYMLLSGNNPHHGRYAGAAWGIGNSKNQFQDFQKSIAETLKEGGNYSTAMYGKWHMGGKVPLAQNGSFDKDKILSHDGHDWSWPLIDGPQDTGFSSSFITASGIQSPPYSYFRDGYLTTDVTHVASWRKGKYDMPFGTSFIKKNGEGDPDWDSTAYNMVIINETKSFIEAHMASDRSEDPWFIYAALGAVHGPWSPPDFYLDGTPIAGTQQSKHMDMLYEMDKAVGSLVAMIEDKELANNTIIIFTSDNGGVRENHNYNASKLGHTSRGPLRGQKGEIYEGGHRVPMIFRYDGQFPVNETRSHIVGLNDIYRTLCHLTGIQVSETSAQNSISFADYIFSERNMEGLRKYLPTWAVKKKELASGAIRFGNMKLIEHYGAQTTYELYDLDNDLGEESNLIQNNTFKGIRQAMKKKLRRVGPCPKDRKSFMLKSGPEKGQKKNCNFFESDPIKCRDGIYLQGEISCNSICGRHVQFCERANLA